MGAILTALGTLLGGLVAAYSAWGTNKRNTYQDSIDTFKEELKQKQEDADLYRKRWLKVEEDNERLKKEIEDLKNEQH